MSFTEIFGGATLYPSGQTYLSLTFSADQQLQWPIEQAIAGNVVASIMDLNATVAGLNVDIPDARQVSQGIQSVFNNFGANTITIRDASGGTILSIGTGEAWVAYLTDNSTLAGSWRIFQLGASVSVANASALAGAGLKAVSTTLNQRIAPTSTAVTPIVWTDSNRAQFTIWTGGLGVLNLPASGVVGSDWFSMIRNAGSGDLTVTPPAGTIDGGATLTLSPGGSATIVTDGANFFTIGLGQSTASFFDFLEINVAGSGDYTLSGVELNRISYRFIGALTGSRTIIVPSSVQQYWVDNSTSGAFSLFVKTVPQVTPVEIIQTGRNILYCDGSNVVSAESNTISFPVGIVQGGTGAITAVTALSNLGGAPLTRTLTAGAGMTGGGDLTADRIFNVVANADASIVVNANDLQVGVLASDAQHGIRGGGTQHAVATEAVLGFSEIATQAEVDAGVDDVRHITPLKLRNASFLTGSYVGASTGHTVVQTPTVEFIIIGSMCFLFISGQVVGISNSASFTISGGPVAVRPSSLANGLCVGFDNNLTQPLRVLMSNAGLLTFQRQTGGDWSSGGFFASTAFTTSGSKGLQGGWGFSYSLNS